MDIDYYMQLDEILNSKLTDYQLSDLRDCIETHLEKGDSHDDIMFIIDFYLCYVFKINFPLSKKIYFQMYLDEIIIST